MKELEKIILKNIKPTKNYPISKFLLALKKNIKRHLDGTKKLKQSNYKSKLKNNDLVKYNLLEDYPLFLIDIYDRVIDEEVALDDIWKINYFYYELYRKDFLESFCFTRIDCELEGKFKSNLSFFKDEYINYYENINI